PFVALLVSGGHTQIMEAMGIGEYVIFRVRVDAAAEQA
ncbi:tRNA (adenosine(37)-N6)-threonylcarbamoyltransferase complex transferase subunit TsaD, partial [Neisseria meningitidis]